MSEYLLDLCSCLTTQLQALTDEDAHSYKYFAHTCKHFRIGITEIKLHTNHLAKKFKTLTSHYLHKQILRPPPTLTAHAPTSRCLNRTSRDPRSTVPSKYVGLCLMPFLLAILYEASIAGLEAPH